MTSSRYVIPTVVVLAINVVVIYYVIRYCREGFVSLPVANKSLQAQKEAADALAAKEREEEPYANGVKERFADFDARRGLEEGFADFDEEDDDPDRQVARRRAVEEAEADEVTETQEETTDDFNKLIQLSQLNDVVPISSQLQLRKNLLVEATAVDGQPNKIIYGFGINTDLKDAGAVYVDDKGLNIHGHSADGKKKLIQLQDRVNVSGPLSAETLALGERPLAEMKGRNTLSINPSSRKQPAQVHIGGRQVDVEGSLVANRLCVQSTGACITRSEFSDIKRVPELEKDLGRLETRMKAVVERAAKEVENRLSSSVERITKIYDQRTGYITVPGTDFLFGRTSRGPGGRAMVQDGGNRLVINYGPDFSGVTIRGNVHFSENINVNGRIYFRDESFSQTPNGTNNSDPYFLEKVTEGGNNSHLRLTINDDGNESFQIWGLSCGVGNCAGSGIPRHYFYGDGTTVHTNILHVPRIQLGRFYMSGVGEQHGNDGWIRLFGSPHNYNAQGRWWEDYRTWTPWGRQNTGFAAGQFWSMTAYYGSDLRMKEGLQRIDSATALERVSALDGYKYRFKEAPTDEADHLGFIAQYVEPIFPELVDEKSSANGLKSIKYIEMIPLLVESIKALKARVEALEGAARI